MSDTSANNKRIAKNTIFLYLRMILLMCVSLYTSRVVLDKLGIEDYGIYNIVGGIVSVFSFISGPMVEATQRYLNFYMGKKDANGVRFAFNASQLIHVGIAALILLFAETIGLWFIYNQLIIPTSRLDSAVWTFHMTMVASVFLVMSYPYNAVIIAREKMHVFAYISIIEAIAKLGIVYLLSLASYDRLVFYAFLIMIIQISISLLYRFYCIGHFPEVKFKVSDIPLSLYKQIISFSGWNFLGNIANVCLQQGTNILINMFFGPTVNAAKGVSVQVQNAVNQLCHNFQMAMRPQIIKSYAASEMDNMHTLIFRASRFSYLLVLILALPLSLKANWVLSIWLKEVPNYASVFVQYTMMFALVQALANPLLTGSVATGNVKKIMSVIATFFIMIIPFCYIALWFGCSPVSVFQIQLVMYILAHIIRIQIVSKQVNFSKKLYCKNVLLPIIGVSIISILIAVVMDSIMPDNNLYNVIKIVMIILIVLAATITIGITKQERKTIITIIKKQINTKIKL